MKSREPQSRREKIRLLTELQSGRRSVQEIRPWKVEFWCQHNHRRDIFTNEATGEIITTEQMQEKERTKGDNILFITILNYEHDPNSTP